MDDHLQQDQQDWPWSGPEPNGWISLHPSLPIFQDDSPSSVSQNSKGPPYVSQSPIMFASKYSSSNKIVGFARPLSVMIPRPSSSSSVTRSFYSSPSPGSISHHKTMSLSRAFLGHNHQEVVATTGAKLPPLEAAFFSRPNVPENNAFFTVKLTNVSWETKLDDISRLFSSLEIPIGHASPHFTHGVHFMMDRPKSKLGTECYVEFASLDHARRALRLKGAIVRGREIDITPVNAQSMFEALFPFRKTIQEPTSVTEEKTAETTGKLIYVTRDEVLSLLNMCKSVRHHPLRRFPDRPFEAVISIISKIPWRRYDIISLQQRDHLFEMLKLSIESLTIHLTKEIAFHRTLLSRLVRAGLAVPLFTEKQKQMLLTTSGLECPKDMEKYVYVPILVPATGATELQHNDQTVTPVKGYIEAKTWDPFYGTSIDTPESSLNKLYPTPPEVESTPHSFFTSKDHSRMSTGYAKSSPHSVVASPTHVTPISQVIQSSLPSSPSLLPKSRHNAFTWSMSPVIPARETRLSPSTNATGLCTDSVESLPVNHLLASFDLLERKCETTLQAYLNLERKHEALRQQYENLEKSRLSYYMRR